MPPRNRRPDFFDPNKSDSNDDDFEISSQRSPRKASRKTSSKNQRSHAGTKRKRPRYRGSDVEDDDVSDSLLEESSSNESEQSEVEIDDMTGRPKRRAARKSAKYEEPSDNEGLEALLQEEASNDEMQAAPPSKRTKLSKVITLKIGPSSLPGAPPSRATRAGSTARSMTRGAPSRRSTRARTEDADELVELSNSGNHVIRPSRTPEPLAGGRRTRGLKGLAKPNTSMVKEEEEHEGVSSEQAGSTDARTVDAEEDREIPQTQEDITNLEAEVEPDVEPDELAGDSLPLVQSDIVGAITTADDDDDDDEDEIPVVRRSVRGGRVSISAALEAAEEEAEAPTNTSNRRNTRRITARTKAPQEPSSDFDPDAAEPSADELSASEASPKKNTDYDTGSPRRGRSGAHTKGKSKGRSRANSDSEDEIDEEELLEEAAELKSSRRRRPLRVDKDIVYEQRGPRVRKKVDYTIKPMDAIYAADEDAEDAAPSTSRRTTNRRAGASQPWQRNLHTAYGPFGGAGGAAPVIGGPWGTGAAGGADSDSSDDDTIHRPVGGAVGMTPTTGAIPGLLPLPVAQHNAQADPAAGGGVANFGRVKSQKALADADPLGVDQNVDFSKVGGLAEHINQLKEMVQIPLLYPELFLQYNITPPRGVLFHGPPGTGKTLLARALAAQVGAGGKKITFYMRKGADALSKWVGEAEKQLRLLFEEARKTQPSIIFFDEIDGLAPVRSSKQEQIHASIVSTLLALMDGMDGRGQVIVIGATNRPDNIDPALRRPGRFDREFYFPLPGMKARRSIINIHTKDWGIDDKFKDNLALATKGYGGADLRALCTEAALNSMQRTYPQIYSSNDKLIVDPKKIKITAKDFMLSIKKLVPSSERATSSGARPLPKVVEPLLREQLQSITAILDNLIPSRKATTALEEAMFEQFEDGDAGFGREVLQQEFEQSRVYRPRLLISGEPGTGQAYLGSAILNHFEGLHVQNFDLPTIYANNTSNPEGAIVQLFAEVKRHKPSVIYLPAIDTWYHTLSDAAITTFLGLLRAIPSTDPILVVGICDSTPRGVSPRLLKEIFGYSKKNQFSIERPSLLCRQEFFQNVLNYVKTAPKDFPDPINRKKRKLEVLEVAAPLPPREPTKEEIKAQKKRDHSLLNTLKIVIQPIMDEIQKKYRKFRNPAIPQSTIQYLYDEQDPDFIVPDVTDIGRAQFRPFELGEDKHGNKGLLETASGNFFYNLETTTIEERLANGYYCRPKDFVKDIKFLVKDVRKLGNKEQTIKANELLTNVEVDLAAIETNPYFGDCENVYQRQIERTKEKAKKAEERARLEASPFPAARSDMATDGGSILLGPPPQRLHPGIFETPATRLNGKTNGSHEGANGSPASFERDTHMGGTEVEDDFVSLWQRAHPHLSSTANQHNTQPTGTQISQTSGFQQIPHDVSPRSIFNDASTTTSGQGTSGKRTSDGANTQYTNGDKSQLQYSPATGAHQSPEYVHESQLVNTQQYSPSLNLNSHVVSLSGQGEGTGGREWPHSHPLQRDEPQASVPKSGSGLAGSGPPNSQSSQPLPAVPLFSRSTAAALPPKPPLPESPDAPDSSPASTIKDLIPIQDEQFNDSLTELVNQSSGCSIEQLEQINRELMCEIWNMRGEWNRILVLTRILEVFSVTIADIAECQKIENSSQAPPGEMGGEEMWNPVD